MLAVAIQDDDDPRSEHPSCAEAGIQSDALAIVLPVPDDDGPSSAGDESSIIGGAVIHDDNILDILAGLEDNTANEAILVIGRNDRNYTGHQTLHLCGDIGGGMCRWRRTGLCDGGFQGQPVFGARAILFLGALEEPHFQMGLASTSSRKLR
jgi:hypothetical protein